MDRLLSHSSSYVPYHRRGWRGEVNEIVSEIRTAAARQHIDAVLVYEISTTSEKYLTPFAIVDVTLVGGLIFPTRHVAAMGTAHALLVDVRNGYPYATATAEGEASGFTTTWDNRSRIDRLRNEAATNVVENLMPEMENMIQKVAISLANRASANE